MRSPAALALVLLLGVPPTTAHAFSVLAHQAVVDDSWDGAVVPELRRRFPDASKDDIERARAFAHGGSHSADLGYFPLGNKLFTDLVHYVRSGDFIAALLARARTVDEYAFALGALSHYVTDDVGHPEATNPSVAEIYPKLRERHGHEPTYADDGSAHITTEFRFDVLQVARTKQVPDLVEHALSFEVATRLLEDAFRATYGLGLDDIFANTDVAIATYRWAFRDLIHEVTGIAWALHRADIEKLDPQATAERFVFDLPRADFEKKFGNAYREPGYFVRFVGVLVELIPDVGPFERMPHKPLPEPVRARFVTAYDHAVARYRTEIARARERRLRLGNDTLDTGHPTRRGEYEPADEAYAELVEKLAERDFADVPRELRADILRFYAAPGTASNDEADDDVHEALGRLEATTARR
jgi:hypothetical protein